MSAEGLTIYGARFSRAARCIWLATELDLPFEHVDVAFTDPSLKAAPYLDKNPMGKVPTIDDRGYVLTESMAINFYLAQKKPNALWPNDVRMQARILQWSFWGVWEVELQGIALGMSSGMAAGGAKNPDAANEARKRLARPLTALNGVLEAHPYILGDAFTLADLNVAGILWPVHFSRADLAPFMGVADWLARCHARPAAMASFGAPTW